MPRVDELIRDGHLAIRRMRDHPIDYSLVARWRAEPHVAEWWDTDDAGGAALTERYRPRTEVSSPTVAGIITLEGRPVGYLQFYPWDDHPDEMATMGLAADENTFGLDILIGEPDLIDRGVGSAAVALLCRYLFDERGAAAVALTTAEANLRAQRAYEKAGMRKVARVLDTDTVNGERVPSWLMVVDRRGLPS